MWAGGMMGGGDSVLDQYLNGEIEADDPSIAELPADVRASIEAAARREAEHKARFEATEKRQARVLETLGKTPYTGTVRIPEGGPMPRVLVIYGLALTDTPWFKEHLLGEKAALHSAVAQREEDREAAAAAWRGIHVDQVSFDWAEDPQCVRICQEAIVGGNYHAIVVCDLCCQDLMEEPQHLFERLIGSHLQSFARSGGRVAFPTSDGLMLFNQKVLHRLFDVSWRPCAYTAENWGPLPPDPGEGVVPTFVAPRSTPVAYTKATSLADVPPEERVCGVVAGGEHGVEIGEDGDWEIQEIGDDGDYETQKGFSAAAHAYGEGSIAYFGDTNCSRHNPPLVAAYCRAGWEAKRRELDRREYVIGLARKVSEERMGHELRLDASSTSVRMAAAAVVVAVAGVIAYYYY